MRTLRPWLWFGVLVVGLALMYLLFTITLLDLPSVP